MIHLKKKLPCISDQILDMEITKKQKKAPIPLHEYFPKPIWAIIVRICCSSRKGLQNFIFVCKQWYLSVLEHLEELPKEITNDIYPERIWKDPLPHLLKFTNLKILKVETSNISLITQLTNLETLAVAQLIKKRSEGFSYDDLFPVIQKLTKLNTLRFQANFANFTTKLPQPYPNLKTIEPTVGR